MDSSLAFLDPFLMLLVPAMYLLAAAFCNQSTYHCARIAQGVTSLAFLAALSGLVLTLFVQLPAHVAPDWLSLTLLSKLMLLLISFIGMIIVRYSYNYLQGEPGEHRYYTALSLALAAVAITVISNHLLVFLGGWVAISMCLHALLRFYPDRPRAALAAYKKFLFARIAELALLCAFILLYAQHGTWQISSIVQAYATDQTGWPSQVAAVLIALAALIKCAQLPVHGWLMQVVEAPTPVSALLHAGVVNMGGYLLILFGPLLMASGWAQALVLLVAGVSTVLAALSMATRVSVKVKLAWSTCAQMGFMLIECALGLFELALLHLMAHSCYKAYAFLNSGSAVHTHRIASMSPQRPAGALRWSVATALGLSPVLGIFFATGGQAAFSIWLLLGLALSVIIAQRSSVVRVGSLLQFVGFALLVLALYILQKLLFSQVVTVGKPVLGPAADLWLCFLFVLLFVGHIVLSEPGFGLVGQRLHQWLFAGLYLDEWSSRLTLKILPLHLPDYMPSRQPYLALTEKVSS